MNTIAAYYSKILTVVSVPISFLLIYKFIVSEAVVRNIVTARQFQHALNKANPGDIIKLKSNEIFFEDQQFITHRSGEAGDPITITGPKTPGAFANIKLDPAESSSPDSLGTTGLTILGDFWIIEGIELLISKPYIGVKIQGNNNSISSLLVTAYETGVYINGSGNILSNSIITSTHGTGLHLAGGDYNSVTTNVIDGSEWGIFMANNTCCGEIVSDTVKGTVMVQGSNHSFRGNVIQGDLLVLSRACDNQFSDVVVRSKNPQSFLEINCPSIDNDDVLK